VRVELAASDHHRQPRNRSKCGLASFVIVRFSTKTDVGAPVAHTIKPGRVHNLASASFDLIRRRGMSLGPPRSSISVVRRRSRGEAILKHSGAKLAEVYRVTLLFLRRQSRPYSEADLLVSVHS
jgi:hypothetical protein